MTRERILTIGGPGSGKTYAWMRLAYHNPDSKFYVIDTEMGAERSLDEFPDIKNVLVHAVVDWEDYVKDMHTIVNKAVQGDWVVVDMVDKAWTAVQRYFIGKVFDKDMGDYYLNARMKMKKDAKSLFGGRDSVLKGWVDWPVINRQYDDFIFPLVYRTKANLYMATSPSAVSEEDEKDVRDLYGPYGVKPAGQKALGHQPDTVLLLAHNKEGYQVTTIKDRGGRPYFDHVKLSNFYYQYGNVARWF